MRRLIQTAAIAAALLLTACGTLPFTPAQYPIRDGLISSMPVSGQARFVNAQTSTAPVTVYSYGGTSLSSDLHSITEVMADQASEEVRKASQPAAGPAKTIDLKVNSLVSEYAIAFHWKSKLDFEAHLGNGEVIKMTVNHSSGVLQQDLDGCIAQAVMALLNDEKLRAYLAQ
jgi:hypothetical protein